MGLGLLFACFFNVLGGKSAHIKAAAVTAAAHEMSATTNNYRSHGVLVVRISNGEIVLLFEGFGIHNDTCLPSAGP